MTDFTIDYILNRAGDKYNGTNGSLGVFKRLQMNQYFHPYLKSTPKNFNLNQEDQIQKHILEATAKAHLESTQQLRQSFEQSPMLDWLQYTRYHPPKLSRSLRQGPSKRTPGRLPRIPFTPAQLQALENAYKSSNYLSAEDANKLAENLDLTNTRVKIWFQNRRARERREKRDKDDCYDSTLSSNASSPEPDFVEIDVE